MKYLLSKEKILENWLNPFLTGATNQNIQYPGSFPLPAGLENPTHIPPPSMDMIEKPQWLDPNYTAGDDDGKPMKGDILSLGRFYINGVPLSQWSSMGGSQTAFHKNNQINNWYYMDAVMKKTFPNGIHASLNKNEIAEYNISEVVIQKMKPTATGVGLNMYVKFKFNENELWGKYENIGISTQPKFVCEQIEKLQIEDQIKVKGKLTNIIYEWFKAKTGVYKCLAKEVLVLNAKGEYDKILEGSIVEVLHSDKDEIKLKTNNTIYSVKKPTYYWFNWYFEKRVVKSSVKTNENVDVVNIKDELKMLQQQGQSIVYLNGFKEDIEYVMSLSSSSLTRIDVGYYETKN